MIKLLHRIITGVLVMSLILPLSLQAESRHCLAPSSQMPKPAIQKALELRAIQNQLQQAMREGVEIAPELPAVKAHVRSMLRETEGQLADMSLKDGVWYVLVYWRGRHVGFAYFPESETLSAPLYSGGEVSRLMLSVAAMNPYAAAGALAKAVEAAKPVKEGPLLKINRSQNVSRHEEIAELLERLREPVAEYLMQHMPGSDMAGTLSALKKKTVHFIWDFEPYAEGWADANNTDAVYVNKFVWERLSPKEKQAFLGSLLAQSERIKGLKLKPQEVQQRGVEIAVFGENFAHQMLRGQSRTGYGSILADTLRRIAFSRKPNFVPPANAQDSADATHPLLKQMLAVFNDASFADENPAQAPAFFHTLTDKNGDIVLPASIVPQDARHYRLHVGLVEAAEAPVRVEFAFDSETHRGWTAQAYEVDALTQGILRDHRGDPRLPLVSWHFEPEIGIVATPRETLFERRVEKMIQDQRLQLLYPFFRHAPVEFEEFLSFQFPGAFEAGEIAEILDIVMGRQYPEGVHPPATVADAQFMIQQLEHYHFPEPMNAEDSQKAHEILRNRLEHFLMNAFSARPEDYPAPEDYDRDMEDRLARFAQMIQTVQNAQMRGLLEELGDIFAQAIRFRPGWLKPGKRLAVYQALAILHGKDPAMANALLGDEPGLGKTLESVGIALEVGAGKTLIVATANTLHNWANEILDKTVVNASEVLVIDGSSPQKIEKLLAAKDPKIRFVIISMDTLKYARGKTATGEPDYQYLQYVKDMGADFIIADEAHGYQSERSARTQAITQLGREASQEEAADVEDEEAAPGGYAQTYAEDVAQALDCLRAPAAKPARKLAITATPPLERGTGESVKPIMQWLDPAFIPEGNLSKMNRKLRARMIRRVKKELPNIFPPLRHERVRIKYPSPWEEYYAAVHQLIVQKLDAGEIETLDATFALRNATFHPSLLPPRLLEELQQGAWKDLPPLPPIEEAPKMKALLDLLYKGKAAGEKQLVFSMSKPVVDAIESILNKHRFGLMRLESKDKAKTITDKEKIFRNDPLVQISLSTYQKGGQSLNEEAARTVIEMDIAWKPATLIQAESRSHRYTQRHAVTVYQLVAEGTLDEDILDIVTVKRRKFALTVDGVILRDDDEPYLEEIRYRLGRWRGFSAFERKYEEMQAKYREGDFDTALRMREELAGNTHLYYGRLPEGIRMYQTFLAVLKLMQEDASKPASGRLIARDVNAQDPLVIANVFAGPGNWLKALLRARREGKWKDTLPHGPWTVLQNDPSEAMLKQAMSEEPLDQLRVESDGSNIVQEKLGLKDKAVDMIVSDFLPNIPNTMPPSGAQISRRIGALHEMARSLREGGVAVFISKRRMPDAMQTAMEQSFGLQRLHSGKMLFDEADIDAMGAGDENTKAEIKKILASTYVYVGRKITHKEMDQAGLIRLSQQKGRFDWAEAAGHRRGGLPHMPVVPEITATAKQLGLSDIAAAQGNPVLRLGTFQPDTLQDVADWEGKPAEILDAYRRHMEIFGVSPDPMALARELGLTLAALGYGVMLHNQATGDERQRIQFAAGSWTGHIDAASVRETYDFLKGINEQPPSFAEISRVFFGDSPQAETQNAEPMMNALNEPALAGVVLRKEQVAVPAAPVAPKPPVAVAITEPKDLPQDPFIQQGLDISGKSSKLPEDLKRNLTLPALPAWTAEEKMVLMAWSACLKELADNKTNRFPTLVETQAAFKKIFKSEIALPALLRIALSTRDKLAGAIDMLQTGKDSPMDRVYKTAVQTKKVWNDSDFAWRFAQLTIDQLGFAAVQFVPMALPAGDDERISLLDAVRASHALNDLFNIGGIPEREFTESVRAFNHKQWLRGQPEILTDRKQDNARIGSGASATATERYGHAREAMGVWARAGEPDFRDLLEQYFLETTEAGKIDYDGLADFAASWMHRMTRAKNPNLYMQLELLMSDEQVMQRMKAFAPKHQAWILDLAMEILLERNSLDNEDISAVITQEIFPKLDVEHLDDYLTRRPLVKRLTHALEKQYSQDHAAIIAEGLLNDEAAAKQQTKALNNKELGYWVDLLEEFNQRSLPYAWMFGVKTPQAGIRYGPDEPVFMPAKDDALAFMTQLSASPQAVGLSDNYKGALFLRLAHRMSGILAKDISLSDILKIANGDHLYPCLRVFNALLDRGQTDAAVKLVRLTADYLAQGYEPDVLKEWYGGMKDVPTEVLESYFSALIPIGKIVSLGRKLGLKDVSMAFNVLWFSGFNLDRLGVALEKMVQQAEVQQFDVKKALTEKSPLNITTIINLAWYFFVCGGEWIARDTEPQLIGEDDSRYAAILAMYEQLTAPWKVKEIVERNGLSLKFVLSPVKAVQKTSDVPGAGDRDLLLDAKLIYLQTLIPCMDEASQETLIHAQQAGVRLETAGVLTMVSNRQAQQYQTPQKPEMVDLFFGLAGKDIIRLHQKFQLEDDVLSRHLAWQEGPKALMNSIEYFRHMMMGDTFFGQGIKKGTVTDITAAAKVQAVMQAYYPFKAFSLLNLFRASHEEEVLQEQCFSADNIILGARRYRAEQTMSIAVGTEETLPNDKAALERELPRVREWIRQFGRRVSEIIPRNRFNELSQKFANGFVRRFYPGHSPADVLAIGTHEGDSTRTCFFADRTLVDAFVHSPTDIDARIALYIILVSNLPVGAESLNDLMGMLFNYLNFMGNDVEQWPGAFDNIALFKDQPALRDHWQIKAAKKLLELYIRYKNVFLASPSQTDVTSVRFVMYQWFKAIGPMDYLMMAGAQGQDVLLGYQFFIRHYLEELEKAKANKSPTAAATLLDKTQMAWIREETGSSVVLSKGLTLPAVMDPVNNICYIDEDFLRYAQDRGAQARAVSMLILLTMINYQLYGDLTMAPCNHVELLESYRKVSKKSPELTGMDDLAQLGENINRFLAPLKDVSQAALIEDMKRLFAETNMGAGRPYNIMFDSIRHAAALIKKKYDRKDSRVMNRLRRAIYQDALQALGEEAIFGWSQPGPAIVPLGRVETGKQLKVERVVPVGDWDAMKLEFKRWLKENPAASRAEAARKIYQMAAQWVMQIHDAGGASAPVEKIYQIMYTQWLDLGDKVRKAVEGVQSGTYADAAEAAAALGVDAAEVQMAFQPPPAAPGGMDDLKKEQPARAVARMSQNSGLDPRAPLFAALRDIRAEFAQWRRENPKENRRTSAIELHRIVVRNVLRHSLPRQDAVERVYMQVYVDEFKPGKKVVRAVQGYASGKYLTGQAAAEAEGISMTEMQMALDPHFVDNAVAGDAAAIAAEALQTVESYL